MPSASAKLEKQMSTEAYDPMKQIVTIVEKKVRNLEKRKGKLDVYRLESQNGKELNEDQKKAVEKYDQVLELLDFAKDLQKQFQTVVQETSRAQKKAAKRDQVERQQQELLRIRELMAHQDLLNSMGGDVREDFTGGNKGAVKLTEAELTSLDELYKAICPEREAEADFDAALSSAAEHVQALLDAKNKEAFGTTYKALRETLQKIHSCSYFQKSDETSQEEELEAEQTEEAQSSEPIAPPEADDYVASPKAEEYCPVPQAQYHAVEPVSPPEQAPIQEVLSGTNLNFLQESQIEVGASRPEPAATLPNYSNVAYSAPTTLAAQRLARRPSEEAMAPPLLASPASLQQAVPVQQGSRPVPTDFDPGRPIPTQTYTNASFHPMMAPPPQSYGLPVNMVQPLPQRTVPAPPVSGLTSAASQQANIFSLCLKMNQLNTESSQPAHVQSLQYDSSEIQETPYQNTNNNQAYMSRDNFGDNSSYSSNLKRGLTSRGGPRGAGGVPRGGNAMPRGSRVGHRY